MNYATDALWWRFQDQHVRALLTLLTAPPLWDSGCELPVRTLLGENGFRYLLALDEAPAPLHDFLQAQAPHPRLGVYAEHLLAFWLDTAPHAELLGRNLHFGQVGEVDFVARLAGVVYHIELACKYFIAQGNDECGMRGFNPKDTLARKRETLARQCIFSHSVEFGAWAQARGLNAVQSVSLVRGMAFLPTEFEFDALNPYGWHGGIALPEAVEADCRAVVLTPHEYLAPARKQLHECVDYAALQAPPNALVALLALRPDGYWHETARVAVR